MSERPKSIRAIFLLTCFKILLAWTFFGVASVRENPLIEPKLIMYTAISYVALAVPTFVFIHKRNAIGVRVCIGLALLASAPVRAYLAIVLDLIALALSFREPAKRFFAQGSRS